MKRKKSLIPLLLVLVLILSACAQAGPAPTTPAATATPAAGTGTGTTPATAAPAAPTEPDFEWPTKLTYWSQVDARITTHLESMSDCPAWVISQERFGVEIEFIHPPDGMAAEQFRVLISGRDLPDVVEHDWLGQYPGGPARAISDGVIIDLTPYIHIDGIASNLASRIAEFDGEFNLSRDLKTANGEYYVFPGFRGEGLIWQNPNGPSVRKDWLDELGLDIPVTVDDWDTMLRRFKSEKGAEVPLTWQRSFFRNGSTFAAPFDAGHVGGVDIMENGFFIDRDGVIKYSGLQPGYRDYMELMSTWYRDGLISPDYNDQNTASAHNDMIEGRAGAIIGQNDSTLATLRREMMSADNDVEIIGVPHPKKNANDPALRFWRWDQFYTPGRAAAITTSNNFPEATATILDWWYGKENTDEGYMLWNFGVEGESYIIEADGKIRMGPAITDNPTMDVIHARTVWMLGSHSPPGLRDVRVVEMQRTDQAVVDATTLWMPQDRSAIVPRISFTEDEGVTRSRLLGDINSLSDEYFDRFVMGREPIANFDNYITELHRAGIEELLEIYNAAYQRWLALS